MKCTANLIHYLAVIFHNVRKILHHIKIVEMQTSRLVYQKVMFNIILQRI